MKTFSLNSFSLNPSTKPIAKIQLNFGKLVSPCIYRIVSEQAELSSTVAQSLGYYLSKLENNDGVLHNVIHIVLEKHIKTIAQNYIAKYTNQSIRDLKNPNYKAKGQILPDNLLLIPLLSLSSLKEEMDNLKEIIIENKSSVLILDGFHSYYHNQNEAIIESFFSQLADLANEYSLVIFTIEENNKFQTSLAEVISITNEADTLKVFDEKWILKQSNDLLVPYNSRDEIFSGVNAQNGQFQYINLLKSPHLLLVGESGSGKSHNIIYTMLDYMKKYNTSSLYFLINIGKGNTPYKEFNKLNNFFSINFENDALEIINLVYEEMLARQKEFIQKNVFNINEYEKIDKKLDRIFVIIEDAHELYRSFFNLLENYNKENTVAYKLKQLLRIGRSHGITIIMSTQKASSSEVPSDIMSNFTSKQVYKVNTPLSSYLLGSSVANSILPSEQGLFYSDSHEKQQSFYIPEEHMPKMITLITEYDSISNNNILLNIDLINKYIGCSEEELYKLKSLSSLCENIDIFNERLVIKTLHEYLGHKVVEIDDSLEPSGVSLISDWAGQAKVAIVIKTQKEPLTSKHILKLRKGMQDFECPRGVIYTSQKGLAQSLYKLATDNQIEIVDHEDLIKLAKQIDYSKSKEDKI